MTLQRLGDLARLFEIVAPMTACYVEPGAPRPPSPPQEVAPMQPTPPPPQVIAPAPPPPQGEVIVMEPPAPPPPQVEPPPPPPPSPDHVWIAGAYTWSAGRYTWERGHYDRRPRLNARYASGHWEGTGRGHVWVAPHWE
jgi:hypothetical protein